MVNAYSIRQFEVVGRACTRGKLSVEEAMLTKMREVAEMGYYKGLSLVQKSDLDGSFRYAVNSIFNGCYREAQNALG